MLNPHANGSSPNGNFPPDTHSAAELYAGRGVRVVPNRWRSKKPWDLRANVALAGWESLRVTADNLDQYFPPGCQANIGGLNGAASNNQADCDLDCPEALLAAPYLLPATGWVFGRATAAESHWLYRTDEPLTTAALTFNDLDGSRLLELRGDGGQTVLPPSVHEDTGEVITWSRFTAPAHVALSDLKRVAAELAAATLLARHWPAKGTRHDARLCLAGGLLRNGWDRDRALAFLKAVTAAANNDGFDDCDGVVRNTAEKLEQGESVRGWPKLGEFLGEDGKRVVSQAMQWLGLAAKSSDGKKLRTIAPYKPFPVAALPAPLDALVAEAAGALGVDPVLVALPCLAVVASLIGNTRTIRLKKGWEEPSIIWSAVVTDSGALKTPAMKCSTRHLFKLQKELLERFKAEMLRYDEEMKEWKAKKRDGADGEDPGPPPEEPKLARVVCSDVTIEKLAEVLEDNRRGTLVARDELAGWFGSHTRYKGKAGGSDLPNWLEMHQAGTIMVDRKTGNKPTLYIPRASVSVTGGIQPGILVRAFSSEVLEAGGAARFLLAMPPKRKKQWREDVIPEAVEHAFHALLDALQKLDFKATAEGEKVPYTLDLSPAAKEVWVAFYNSWAQEQANAEGDLAAAFSKLEAYAARLALVHHVVTHVGLDTSDLRLVGLASMKAGIRLAKWFGNEIRRIYATLSETDEERTDRRLVEWILNQGGRTTVHALQNSNSRKYPDAASAELALEALARAKAGHWVQRPATAKGGRPTKDFVLFPTEDGSDNTDTTTPGGDDESSGPPDETPDTTPDGPRNPQGSGSCVGIVGSSCKGAEAPEAGGAAEGFCRTQGEVTSDDPGYTVVRDQADLAMVLMALEGPEAIGLDLETTGLNSSTDRVRLLALDVATTEGPRHTYLVDAFRVDLRPVVETLGGRELVAHNAAFDLGFLTRLGLEPGTVHDTMLISQVVYAGDETVRHRLADCVARELGQAVDKEEQRSDWSGELTAAQLAYAARDAAVLAPLYEALRAKAVAGGVDSTDTTETRCLPAVAWMAQKGVGFDRDTWLGLAGAAAAEAERLAAELDAMAPPVPGMLVGRWKWDSPADVTRVFNVLNLPVRDSRDATLAALEHPLAGLLRSYREAKKRATTYGQGWLKHVAADGRVYAGWRQVGAASGRMSCRTPNLQQFPRQAEYRRCVAAGPGNVLVKADYSQIELRIAAKVSGDQALLDAYRRGEDLHTQTARAVLGVAAPSKEHRQLAKALNFGLLYGMGAKCFRVYARTQFGLELTQDQAVDYRRAFFAAYPGLRSWHARVSRSEDAAVETRTLGGRRRLGVTRFTEKLNTPVQGTGADGLKLALALLWERRAECPGAFPVLAVHDEIVVEVVATRAGEATAWVRQAMLDAMGPLIAPVPVEVDVKVGRTWAGD